MASFASPSYLTRHQIETALKTFVRSLPAGSTVYDIGCGHQPYAPYFKHHRYLGIDTDVTLSPDIHYNGQTIPLPDASADAIICTETLQHSEAPVHLMNEIHRLLKNGGRAFISVPFGIKMLAEPYPSTTAPQNNFSAKNIPYWRTDYWRFTQFGFLRLLARFEVATLQPTTGYIGTLLQLKNYGLASLGLGILFKPYYLLSNTLGWLADTLFYQLTHKTTFYQKIYTSLTCNYIAVIKKP